MHTLEIDAGYAREQYRDQLAIAEHSRMVRGCRNPLTFTRRAARPLGRVLAGLGAWLLRYGQQGSVVRGQELV